MKNCTECGLPFGMGRCLPCRNELHRLRVQVWTAKSRARKHGEPAALTFDEWMQTLDHFNYRCAYCGEDAPQGYNVVLEHFIPLGMGHGSVKSNCVPACPYCNIKKRGYHPTGVPTHLIPQSSIERVYHYLQSVS